MISYFSYLNLGHKAQLNGSIVWHPHSDEDKRPPVYCKGRNVALKKCFSVEGWSVHNRISFIDFCSCLSQAVIQWMASPSLFNKRALFLPALPLAVSGWQPAARCTSAVLWGKGFFFPFFWVKGLHLWGSFCGWSRWNVRLQGWWIPFLHCVEHFCCGSLVANEPL